ncbi:MAG: hypothetical protein WCA37_06370 [Terracidiphilus sp.]
MPKTILSSAMLLLGAAAALLLFGTVMCRAQAQDSAVCSNETLRGDYAFTIVGTILAPAPASGPVSGVAMTHFDGQGEMTQVDHVVHNGIPPAEEWRPGGGPYHVNADCTGYMVITPQPTDAQDASPPLRLEFVVGGHGSLIQTVVNGTPVPSPFSAVITSTGTKVLPSRQDD